MIDRDIYVCVKQKWNKKKWNIYAVVLNPGKNPSQNELSGENPSGEDPSKVSCGENPSPYFGACGENPSCYFQACGENPSTL